MRVADRLAQRESSWRELDELLSARASRPGPFFRRLAHRRSVTKGGESPAGEVLRLGALYRSACADLMLAESHELPRETVAYLHHLVARAHNEIYRSRGLGISQWAGVLVHEVPRRLRGEPMLALATLWFLGPLLIFAMLGASGSDAVYQVMPPEQLQAQEESFSAPIGENPRRNDAFMAGFYLRNNASIGLQCYVWGLSFGLGTIVILATNGMIIGTVAGFMTRSPSAGNFFEFVTVHSAFELTAIVFAGAAGLRLGWSLIATGGRSRLGSLQKAARETLPTIGAAVFLFLLAAFLEGFVSASTLPYPYKAAIASACALLLAAYLLLGGRTGQRGAPASVPEGRDHDA